ncbi:MAG: VanZ family protein [Eubacteriales bacterium]|nr:VanZ family protein [Eubacteriales bacterium]MDD3881598.1 VanZ family protein [Eubacteriales bacterium]MDD4512343.1 VanZ family protein [Eubacteriales bacterium]
MNSYISAIGTAFLIFPFAAALFAVPYLIYQYRRFGGLPLIRSLIVYSFILYEMCAYFLTMLPLPPIAEVAALTTPTLQLEPLKDLMNAFHQGKFALSEPITWWNTLKSSAMLEILFNILMCVPLGIYLRYYFRCSWKKTFVIGLLVSLVYELTQLSGLFFIYPRPYRLCETDDLIKNTLGTMIGYWITPIIVKILPTRDELDKRSYKKGEHVSWMRRLIALSVDWCFYSLLIFLLNSPIKKLAAGSELTIGLIQLALYIVFIFVCFIILQWRFGGQTIGKKLVKIRVVSRDGSPARFSQLLCRYSIIYSVTIIPSLLMLLIENQVFVISTREFNIGMTIAAAVFALLVVFIVMMRIMRKGFSFPHSSLSRTKSISTIERREEISAEKEEGHTDERSGKRA